MMTWAGKNHSTARRNRDTSDGEPASFGPGQGRFTGGRARRRVPAPRFRQKQLSNNPLQLTNRNQYRWALRRRLCRAMMAA